MIDIHLLEEFAFYVNKNGRRSRKDFMVHWEGTPTGFGTLVAQEVSSAMLNALHCSPS